MPDRDRSPYELVLGSRLEHLHPRLRTYFSAIPTGSVGFGTGVFDRVGTPRRFLWPVLRVLARQNMLFPVWSKRVPFEVENRAFVDAHGNVAVDGRRDFHLSDGDRLMIDAITAVPRGDGFVLVDFLGPDRWLRADLDATTREGELHLTSRRVSGRIGTRHFQLPRFIAPIVRLRERFDDETDRQHVTVTVDMPVLGRIYEYSGAFSYEIHPRTAEPPEKSRR